jgi:hypothetical protein
MYVYMGIYFCHAVLLLILLPLLLLPLLSLLLQ